MRHRSLTPTLVAILVTGLVATLVTGLGACADDRSARNPSVEGTTAIAESTIDAPAESTQETTDPRPGDDPGDVPDVMPPTSLDADVLVIPSSDVLEAEEVAGLRWMREEEQLAHDVYVALGAEWGIRVFENISASEQQHIDLMLGLLDRYDIDDPAAGNELGTFTDPRIQDLYDDLVAHGMESKIAALTVGATIEELDIADLRARAEATDEMAIDDAYARLERASRNHLRAFVGQLDLLGVDYQATVLPDVDEIVSSPMERGGGGGH